MTVEEKTTERKNHSQLANQAQRAAVKRLQANHAEEFDLLHKDERLKRGLPAEKKTSWWSLVKENARLKEELEKLKNGHV